MKNLAVFDIRLGRPGVSCSRRCPDPTLYEGALDGCGTINGALPYAGATVRNPGLLMR